MTTDSSRAVELSARWTRTAWGSSLAAAAAVGAVSGGMLTSTVAGAALGAFTALPGGAIAALTLWCLGSVSIRALTPDLGSWRRRRPLFRVGFGVLAGCFIGLEMAVTFALLAGAPRETTAWVAVSAVAVAVAGIIYPPRPPITSTPGI